MKKDPNIIRPGDRVRVVTPLQFLRCGYPKTPEDYLCEATKKLASFGLKMKPYVFDRVADRLAWGLCVTNGYGGRDRTIHTQESPDLLGKTFVVREVRTVMTGVYFPPRGWSQPDYWTGESDYEPGGLDKQKSHRIAQLVQEDGIHIFNDSTLPEVEVIHLEKLKEKEP